jgi:diguanylate cyclase (GGDEF)-like protein
MNVYILIITTLVVSSTITLSLALYASKKLRSNGSTAYMLLMLSVSFYSLGYAFELYNFTVAGIFLALKIEYIGIATLPVFWVIFAFKYTGSGKKIAPLTYFLLFIIPFITIILLYTNNYHHLYYLELGINNKGPFPLVIIVKGIWYYIHIGYTNILLLIGTVLFTRMMFQKTGTLRKQALTMFMISLIPWVGNILYLMGLSPYSIDLNPFFLTITGPLFALALFRYGMFDITPIARDLVFEEMLDPVIVLDNEYRIADYNKAARASFNQLNGAIIGTSIDRVIIDNKLLMDQIYSSDVYAVEIEINIDSMDIYYTSQVAQLLSSSKKEIGKIITLHDISAHKKMQQMLHDLATTDELTKLYNRRHFIKISKSELIRSRRYKRPVSILIIDLDHFKKINDSYGHQTGDEVLIQAAWIFTETLRDNDVVARYGGEEFTALLPEIDEQGALLTAERIRENLEISTVSFKGNKINITASIGIGTCSIERYSNIENDDLLLEKLLTEADEALYRAKEEGRNKVIAYEHPSK